MEPKSSQKNSTSLNFHQFARPISDYFLSKAKQQFNPPKPATKSLYEDALTRKSRQESQIKAAADSAKQSANLSKLTKKSEKLFQYNRIKEIEDTISEFENPTGFISKDALSKILEKLSLILPETYVFKTLKAKVQNSMQEQALLTQIWTFLSPPDDDFIIKELMYDLLSILMDKNCDMSTRIEDLKRLKNCIEAVNESSPTPLNPCTSLVKEFEQLMDRRKVLGFHRQQEMIKKAQQQFSFHPEINQQRPDSLVGLERCEALYRNYQEKEDKILCNKLTALEKELNECTFTPVIISGRSCGTERKNKEKVMSWKERVEESEMKECTFKPVITKEVKMVECDKPRGFDRFVEMLRNAQNEKMLKIERERLSNGENYEKMREMKPCPPSFLFREKEQRNIIMYIDVNLGLGKKGKVALREGDDPKTVAENFCKIYQLGKDYELSLEEELVEQLRDIAPSTE